MPTSRFARVLLLTGVLAALGLGAGCSKSPDGVSAGTTQPGTTEGPAKADAASAGGKKETCDPAVLVPVIQKKYGAAGVDHLVCLVPNAVVTVKTGGDDTVAFLVQQGGAWVIAVDGPTADAQKLLPKDFPSALLRSWDDKRTAGSGSATTASTTARVTTTQRPSIAEGEGIVCTGEGGDYKCVTSTAPKPTTTKPPTTTAPPTTPTTAAPVTTPAPPTTFSQFCLDNPLDPSCSGKK